MTIQEAVVSQAVPRLLWVLIGTVLAVGVWLLGPSQALATPTAPAWSAAATSYPTDFLPGAVGDELNGPGYLLLATNIGGAPTTGAYEVTDILPAGLTPVAGEAGRVVQEDGTITPCTAAGQSVTCSDTIPLQPGRSIQIEIPVDISVTEGTTVGNSAMVSGGGAPVVSASTETTITSTSPPFGFIPGPAGLYGSTTWADGSAATQAGSHPYQLTVGMGFPRVGNGSQGSFHAVGGGVKDIVADLPQGVVLDPQAVPRCTEAQLETQECPDDSQVGLVAVQTSLVGPSTQTAALYDMVPPPGAPAEFGFEALRAGIFIHIFGRLRSDGDYELSGETSEILSRAENPIFGAQVSFWGDPSDESHDATRGECLRLGTGCSVPRTDTALLTTPSACSGPIKTVVGVDSWVEPGVLPERSYQSADLDGNPVGIEGCASLPFTPTISLKPTVTTAETSSGLEVDLHVPQDENYEHLAEANLKDVRVTLPAGIAVNPSAANGLEACTPSQVGLTTPVGQPAPIHFTDAPAECPDAAKIGTVEVDTPLLDHPLNGSIYVAQPHQNPFGSLLAIYVAVHDEESGVVIKLAGHVEADPTTGQLTTTFSENPELPFEDFHLDFFGGPRAALKTPDTCGGFASRSELSPWSGNPANVSEDPFQIGEGAKDGACASSEASLPNQPAFEAGTLSPAAGAYSPFVLHLRREDGSRQLRAINVTLPPGLTGKLAGISYCPDSALAAAERENGTAEQAEPSCPAASEIGQVTVGAGAGPDPYYVTGRAYLAGPYKGAPLSLAIVTPAVAGPYDLGTVVVRSALYVDPVTTQITVKSDPIPTILQGIPLDVRSIAVEIDKADFTRNPTSCEPMALGAEAIPPTGGAAMLGSRFKAEGCRALPFKPKLALRVFGRTNRNSKPRIRAVLTTQPGEANIRRAQVNLPHSEFLEQNHLNKTCTKPVLEAGRCPASTIYGRARAFTPLLEKPLEGLVYLVGGYGYKLPALVAELNGQIRVLLVGKVDSGKNKGIRNTFEIVPDAPVSRFILELKGGGKGLLVNSEPLCSKKAKTRAIVRFVGQNGKVEMFKPHVANSCRKTKKKSHAKRHHHRSDGR